MEPTCTFSDINLVPPNLPKSCMLAFQEALETCLLYKQSKVLSDPHRPMFCCPRPTQHGLRNETEICGKPISRAFYFELLFRDLLKPLPERSRGPLGHFFYQQVNVGPNLAPPLWDDGFDVFRPFFEDRLKKPPDRFWIDFPTFVR